MRIKFKVEKASFVVTSKQGNEILAASYGDFEFDGDVASLVQELARLNAEIREAEAADFVAKTFN